MEAASGIDVSINKELSQTTLEELYFALGEQNERKIAEYSTQIILYADWFFSVIKFDPLSDKILSDDFDSFLERCFVEYLNSKLVIKDRIFHILEFTKKDLDYLLVNLREKIFRNHENLPLYAVRETDSKSLQVLARKPGRTIKEKLSGQPYVYAAKRRFSFDTLENQLFKEFLQKFVTLLQMRQICFEKAGFNVSDEATEYISKLNYFKNSVEFSEIGKWKNNPPNNVLLQDKHYRKIWKSWNNLRTFNEKVKDDYLSYDINCCIFIFFNTAMMLKKCPNFRMMQTPLQFSQENFLSDYLFKGIYISKNFDKIISVEGVLHNNFINFKYGNDNIYLKFENRYCYADKNGTPIKKAELFNSFLTEYPKELLKTIIGHQFNSNVEKNEFSSSISQDIVGIDFSLSTPNYCGSSSSPQILPFRLMIQNWIKNGDSYLIPCVKSNAICFDHKEFHIENYSIRSILYGPSRSEKEQKKKNTLAATQLASFLYKYLKTDKVYYSVPDLIDDFDVQPLRIGMNSCFAYTKPVPVSIATCIGSMISGNLNDVQSQTLILVVDIAPKGFSFTPVYCDFDKDLKNQFPKSKGIQFIRYPTISSRDKFVQPSIKKSVEISDLLLNTLMLYEDCDSISVNLDKTSYSFDGENFEHPHFLTPKKSQLKLELTDIHVKKIIDEIGNNIQYSQLKIIKVKNCIDTTKLNSYCIIENNPINTAIGVRSIYDLEKKLINGTVLWYDYLPDLYIEAIIEGKLEAKNLVYNKKVNPKLNEAIPINIDWNFILPKNRKFFHFPLIIGKGKKRSSYEAYIESADLPLKEDTKCILKLTYTYGAEQSYNLQFEPVDKKIKTFTVQWLTKDEIPVDLDSLQVPSFPISPNESYFRNYPKNSSSSDTSDVVEWFENNLSDLLSIKIHLGCSFIEEIKQKKGICLYFSTKDKARFEWYLPEYKVNQKEQIKECVKKSPYIYEICNSKKSYSEKFTTNQLRKKLRFPTICLFNNGRKLDDFNSATVGKAVEFMNKFVGSFKEPIKQTDYDFFNECLYIICAMCKELPKKVIDLFYNGYIDNNASSLRDRMYSFVLQDASQEWQKALLNKIIEIAINCKSKKDDIFVISVFSQALWLNKSFILNLSKYQIEFLAQFNCKAFTTFIDQLSSQDNNSFKSDSKKFFTTKKTLSFIVYCFEMMLGLLRARSSEDYTIKEIFVPNSIFCKNYLSAINKFKALISDKKIDNKLFKSFLEIEINDAVINKNNFILLQVLEIYLKSEDIAGSIRITGIDLDE